MIAKIAPRWVVTKSGGYDWIRHVDIISEISWALKSRLHKCSHMPKAVRAWDPEVRKLSDSCSPFSDSAKYIRFVKSFFPAIMGMLYEFRDAYASNCVRNCNKQKVWPVACAYLATIFLSSVYIEWKYSGDPLNQFSAAKPGKCLFFTPRDGVFL